MSRINPSHPDCPGISPHHRHYQGKCMTDWNWGLGSRSNEARKLWPRHGRYAVVRPASVTGWWEWRIFTYGADEHEAWGDKTSNEATAHGRAMSSAAAKAAATEYVKNQRWVLGPKRKNPSKTAREGRARWGLATCRKCQGSPWGRDGRACRACRGTGQVHKVMKHGRRPNPGLGMPGMPHTWVTARGEHISAGDTIAFRVPSGMGRHGRDWKVVEAKVQRLLVFDDHVVAKYGSSGTVVDDTNFVNLVRKAPRSNPLFGPKRDLQHYLITDRRSGNWLSVVEGTDLMKRAEKYWKQQGFKTASKKITEDEAKKRGIGHRQFGQPPRTNPILSVISNPLLSIASNPARRRRRKRR